MCNEMSYGQYEEDFLASDGEEEGEEEGEGEGEESELNGEDKDD